MKRANKFFTHLGLALLMGSLLVACGKDNKSGQSGSLTQYGINGLTNGVYGNIGTISNSVVAAIVNENTCIGGQNGVYTQGTRYGIQQTISINGTIASGDYYVAVTSYGDVGLIVGTGAANSATFVGYICSRGMGVGSTAQQPYGISLLSYTNCQAKSFNATLYAEGYPLAFRSIMYGSSKGTKFSVCY